MGETAQELTEFYLIEKINGFFSPDDYLLFRYLNQVYGSNVKKGLEIGVFCGKSLLGLACAFESAQFVGVDPFFEDFFNPSAFKDEDKILSTVCNNLTPKERISGIFSIGKQIDERFDKDVSSRITVIESTQEDFIEANQDRFALCHLDGEHSYRSVKYFFDRIDRLMVNGSLIIVDDFFNPQFPGIAEAVYTHPSFKTSVFPLVYTSGKAAFLYNPADNTAIETLARGLQERYESDTFVVNQLEDESIVVSKRLSDKYIEAREYRNRQKQERFLERAWARIRTRF